MNKDDVVQKLVKIVKVKKNKPTVIEIDGRKYVYESPDTFRGHTRTKETGK